MAHLKKQIDLLTKHLISGKTEKVKAVGSKGRADSDSEEEANYLNNQGFFHSNSQGNQGWNYYDKAGYKDRDEGIWKNNNDRSGLYIPSGSCDNAATSSGKISMEDIMEKLLKGFEATNTGVTMMKCDLSFISQLVNSHSTAIKQLEQQMGQLSTTFNQRKSGTLPSDIVKNLWTNGKMLSSPCLGASSYINEVKMDKEMVDKSPVVLVVLGG